MDLFRFFRDDCSGTSAVEFALGAPLLALVLVSIATGWNVSGQVLQMRNAVKVGASYFIQGGSDLNAAKSAVTAAWEHPPNDATVTVTSQCTCAGTASLCTDMCTSTMSAPQMTIRIQAVSTMRAPILGFVYNQLPSITQQEIVRVR